MRPGSWTAALLLGLAALARPVPANAMPTQPASAPPGFRNAYTTIDGVRFHYLIGGHGPAVLLLHGWPVTAYAWRHVAPVLAGHFTVIAPDMPGLGDSGPSPLGYGKQIVAREIHGLVRHLGFSSVLLAGHDMGGPVAVAYSFLYPDEVRKLALIETMMPGFGLEDLKAIPAWHIGFAQVPDLPETLVTGRERAFLSYFYRRGMLRKGALAAGDIDEYVRAYSLPGRMSAGFDYYRAMKADIPVFRRFAKHKLTIPVLAVGAEHGIGTNAGEFREFATNVSETTIAGSGHHIPDDQPQVLAQALAGFFGEGH